MNTERQNKAAYHGLKSKKKMNKTTSKQYKDSKMDIPRLRLNKLLALARIENYYQELSCATANLYKLSQNQRPSIGKNWKRFLINMIYYLALFLNRTEPAGSIG